MKSERYSPADEVHTITLVFMAVRHLKDVVDINAQLEHGNNCTRGFAERAERE